MKLNVKHEAVIYWVITEFCNFSCAYCIANSKGRGVLYSPDKNDFSYYDEKKKYTYVNVEKLIKTLNDTKKIFKFMISGGDPFFIENAVELFTALSKKHYLEIHSNMTSDKIPLLLEKIDTKRINYIHASLHIDELIRHNLLDQYIKNYTLCRNAEIPIEAVIIGHPRALKNADFYIDFFKKRKVNVTFDHYIGECDGKLYPNSYTEKELMYINEDDSCNAEDYVSKETLCNASYNCFAANFKGDLTPCYYTDINMGNLFKKIRFSDSLMKCPVEKCYDPMFTQESDIMP